jgi:acyl-CoA synthetase (AMP-forming)/AMP-acid ligase II
MPARWFLQPPPAELRARWLAQGHWTDDTLGPWVDAHLQRFADRRLRVWSRSRAADASLAELREQALRVAGGLHTRGIGAGDVVAIKLPNWSEVAVAIWAAAYLGAVIVPIVHFYGARELGFILRESGAKALVTADRSGSIDHLAALAQVRAGAPALELVAVVGEAPAGTLEFAALARSPAIDAPVRVGPDEPVLVGYTSGSTADPKGVIHTHRSLLAAVREPGNGVPVERPYLAGSPISHAMGVIGGFLYPLSQGRSLHFIDAWEPALVLEAMRTGQAVFNWGPPFFLTSLLDSPEFRPSDLESMRFVGLGGAPVPEALGERLERVGIRMVRAYGSTEQFTATMSGHEAPAPKRLRTDGRPGTGTELRIADDGDRPVPVGTPGELQTRSPRNFAGYTDPALTRRAHAPGGWYRSGDIAVQDADGYVTIVDRKADIIIRGGENISAAEVEDLLLRFPGVAEAAVVAAPDARMGEHACAFVRLAPGARAPRLPDLQQHLAALGLAKQKWPEELRIAGDFPRTPSGKIRKPDLRALLRAGDP